MRTSPPMRSAMSTSSLPALVTGSKEPSPPAAAGAWGAAARGATGATAGIVTCAGIPAGSEVDTPSLDNFDCYVGIMSMDISNPYMRAVHRSSPCAQVCHNNFRLATQPTSAASKRLATSSNRDTTSSIVSVLRTKAHICSFTRFWSCAVAVRSYLGNAWSEM